jgi:hypothetical protein
MDPQFVAGSRLSEGSYSVCINDGENWAFQSGVALMLGLSLAVNDAYSSIGFAFPFVGRS